MDKQEYRDYEARVKTFFQKEGIANLSAIPNNEPYFSHQPCECCKRNLGGDRIDANGYNPKTKEIYNYSICLDCEYYAEYGQLDDMTMLDIED